MPARNINIDAALVEARERFTERNSKSKALYEEACSAMPGGNTRTVLFYAPFPVAIASGAGCRLRDADGHDYIDFLGEYTAGLYGHSHPTIRAAIDRALDGGINLSGHNLVEAKLARTVCDRFPSLDLVRFTNSGTEANLMALATATVATGRRKILVFEGGYHGGVFYFSGGGSPINAPYDFVLGRYNDVKRTRELLEEHGQELAAILVEPMLGGGGCIPGERDFLLALREGATRHGAVLIFDEVMTSRLSPGGLQEALGIIPDMTTLGEGLRRRLNALCAARRAPMQFTGYGSLMSVHFSAEPVRTPADAAAAHQALKELFFFDMLERGIYLARRGMLILSLPIGEAECDRLAEAVEEFLATRAPLLVPEVLNAA